MYRGSDETLHRPISPMGYVQVQGLVAYLRENGQEMGRPAVSTISQLYFLSYLLFSAFEEIVTSLSFSYLSGFSFLPPPPQNHTSLTRSPRPGAPAPPSSIGSLPLRSKARAILTRLSSYRDRPIPSRPGEERLGPGKRV